MVVNLALQLLRTLFSLSPSNMMSQIFNNYPNLSLKESEINILQKKTFWMLRLKHLSDRNQLDLENKQSN